MESERTLHLQTYPHDPHPTECAIHYDPSSTEFHSVIHPRPPHAHIILDPPALAPPTAHLSLPHLIARNLPNASDHLQHPLPLARTHSAHHSQTRSIHDWCGPAQRAVPLRRILGVWKREACREERCKSPSACVSNGEGCESNTDARRC
jgi:hypothetical protein